MNIDCPSSKDSQRLFTCGQSGHDMGIASRTLCRFLRKHQGIFGNKLIPIMPLYCHKSCSRISLTPETDFLGPNINPTNINHNIYRKKLFSLVKMPDFSYRTMHKVQCLKRDKSLTKGRGGFRPTSNFSQCVGKLFFLISDQLTRQNWLVKNLPLNF